MEVDLEVINKELIKYGFNPTKIISKEHSNFATANEGWQLNQLIATSIINIVNLKQINNLKEAIVQSPLPGAHVKLDMGRTIADEIQTLIHKSEIGERLWQTDPVFRNSIEVIARGADPIKVLANVCEMFKNQNEAFIHHMKVCAKASTLMPDKEG